MIESWPPSLASTDILAANHSLVHALRYNDIYELKSLSHLFMIVHIALIIRKYPVTGKKRVY
jgi:hypothetical protein